MKLIHSLRLPPSEGHYSHAVVVGDWIYISEMLPYRMDINSKKKILPVTVQEQAEQILKNLEILLLEAGTTFKALVQLRVYIPDVSYIDIFEPCYKVKIGMHQPARIVVPCASLRGNTCFMLEAVAYQPAFFAG